MSALNHTLRTLRPDFTALLHLRRGNWVRLQRFAVIIPPRRDKFDFGDLPNIQGPVDDEASK